MARCETCGNQYERCFTVLMGGQSHTFDCFECAIDRLSPICGSCACRIIGHGVESDEGIFCSAHCARGHGVEGITTHVRARAGSRS